MSDEQKRKGEPFLLERTYTEPNIRDVVLDAVGVAVYAFLAGLMIGRADFVQVNWVVCVILVAAAGILCFVNLVLDLKHMTYRALNVFHIDVLMPKEGKKNDENQ